MQMPFFIPIPKIVPLLKLKHGRPLREHCAKAGVVCRGSGAWTQRLVEVRFGAKLQILIEPGDWGAVLITAPTKAASEKSRLALYILAYGLHDLVAKESIRNTPLSEVTPPLGRPRISRALTNRERQKRFRERRKRVQQAPKENF